MRRSIARTKPRGGKAAFASASRVASGRARFALAISSRLYSSILARMSDTSHLRGVGHRNQAVKAAFGLTAVDRFGRQRGAFLQILGVAGNDKRSGGIEDGHIAERTRLALEHVEQRLGVLHAIAAAQRFRLDAGQAGIFG